jgi:hypothetical protein
MNQNGEPSNQTDLTDRTRELIEFTCRLNQEYTELIETSIVLRKESRLLSEESRILRRAGLRLQCD